jgi:3-oxoacyl-[acyl-carrier protein] reductase
LKHKAFITGGTHGIGLACASDLYYDDDKEIDIIIASRTQHQDFSPLGWQFIPFDATQRGSYPTELDPEIDILINNIGGGGRWGSDFLSTDDQVWYDVFQKNIFCAVYFTRLLLPQMLKKKWGRVITISSIYGKEAGGRPWFNAAKSSQISLMKSLARTYRDSGVTFNTVAPGHIHIEGKEDFDQYEDFMRTIFKVGQPEDVAGIVNFLCSEQASFINGALIVCDGGESRSY